MPRIRAARWRLPVPGGRQLRGLAGPNSNTFVAQILRAVPDLPEALPPTALGKDFSERILAPTPSRTGWQVTWRGYAGLTLGWVEGVEINLFGAVLGLGPAPSGAQAAGLGPHRPRSGGCGRDAGGDAGAGTDLMRTSASLAAPNLRLHRAGLVNRSGFLGGWLAGVRRPGTEIAVGRYQRASAGDGVGATDREAVRR